jgi:hypothetical protein
MASTFHPVVQPGSAQPVVRHLTCDSAATFVAGALVYLDTADGLIKECGADPANILGVAQCSAAARAIYTGSRIPIQIITPEQIWAMCSSTTPAESHLTDAYGIVKSTYWKVDTSDTSATKVHVIDYAPKSGEQGQEMFYVRFMAASLQGDAIAS